MTGDPTGTSEAMNRLREFSPEPPDENLSAFARLLADRFDLPRERPLQPYNFFVVAALLLADLRRGVDGHTRTALDGPLVGQTEDFYDGFYNHLPLLASVAISEAFGDELKVMLVEYGVIPTPPMSTEPPATGS